MMMMMMIIDSKSQSQHSNGRRPFTLQTARSLCAATLVLVSEQFYKLKLTNADVKDESLVSFVVVGYSLGSNVIKYFAEIFVWLRSRGTQKALLSLC
jgi:hypothetical protein